MQKVKNIKINKIKETEKAVDREIFIIEQINMHLFFRIFQQ